MIPGKLASFRKITISIPAPPEAQHIRLAKISRPSRSRPEDSTYGRRFQVVRVGKGLSRRDINYLFIHNKRLIAS
jgi:hypothetical protein